MTTTTASMGAGKESKTAADILANSYSKIRGLYAPVVYVEEKGLAKSYPSVYKNTTEMPAVDKFETFESLQHLGVIDKDDKAQVIIPVTESDTNALREKKKDLMRANFDSWFSSTYDMASPGERETLRRINPDFFENKIKLNKEIHDFQHEIASIKIRGPQNFEELTKLFVMGTLPPESLTQGTVSKPPDNPKQTFDAYYSGIFANLQNRIPLLFNDPLKAFTPETGAQVYPYIAKAPKSAYNIFGKPAEGSSILN